MAAKQQPQQQSGGGDNSLDFLWLIVMVIVAAGLIWYFGKAYITEFVLALRYAEIQVIQMAAGWWNEFALWADWLKLPAINLTPLNQWIAFIHTKPPVTTFNILAALSTAVGNYLRYPVMAILILVSIYVFRRHIAVRFQQMFNMTQLKNLEQENWPQIKPTVGLDLVKMDIDAKPWAMSTTPLQFCKDHKIFTAEPDEEGRQVPKLMKDAAQSLFALQMGPLFTDLNRLPIHVQALFAAFAARGNDDGKAGNGLLDQINRSSGPGNKLDFSGAQALLAKHAGSKVVGKIVSRHAYLYTVMASMLELARTDGVLSTADFLWLKPLDRRLWYVLNNVGRQTAFVEIAGVYAHWLAEKELGRPLRVPMVEQAVVALEDALNQILYDAEEYQ